MISVRPHGRHYLDKLMRKINLIRFSLLLVLAFPLRMFAADQLPKPFTFARYQPMMDRSPFAVATAVAAPVAAPNFAKDLYIANAGRHQDGDMVTIASSTDKTFKKYLNTTTTVDGFSITSIEWSEKVGATKVTIAKDGQTATLSFNEALLHQAIPGAQNIPPEKMAQDRSAAAAQQPPSSLSAVPPPNAAKAMPVPMLPTPPPRVRGVIPRNPAPAPANVPLQPPPAPPQPQQQPEL
jgi:hypothetical protein